MHRSRRVFYTRIGWPIWSISLGTIALFSIGYSWEMLWRVLTVLCMVEVFAIGLIMETEYTIESDNSLHISGPLIRKRVIAVASIQRIETIRDFSPAPAFSPNRLAIHHSTNELVLISPQRQADFIAHLKVQNPDIAIQCNPG